MELIPLQCNRCGDNLVGLNNDVVFQCRRCGVAFEREGSGFRRFEIAWVAPRRENSAPVLMLPFWKFDVSYDILGEVKATRKRLEAVPRIPAVYVTAFFQRDIFYYGDIGFFYTQTREHLPTHDAGALLLGASRSREEASVYPRLFILKIFDQMIDVTGFDVTVTIEKTSLLGVPFFDLGDKLVDSVQGIEIASNCLDDLNEMRSFQ